MLGRVQPTPQSRIDLRLSLADGHIPSCITMGHDPMRDSNKAIHVEDKNLTFEPRKQAAMGSLRPSAKAEQLPQN